MGAPIYGYTRQAEKALEKDREAVIQAIKIACDIANVDYKDLSSAMGVCYNTVYKRTRMNPELLTLADLRKLSSTISLPATEILTLAGIKT